MIKNYSYELDEALKGNIDESTLIQFTKITIAHIGPNTTWEDLESYLASKVAVDDPILDSLHASIFTYFQESEISEPTTSDGTLHTLSFKDAQTAQAFLAFTQHAFPIIHTEYPKINQCEVILTDDQLFFCRRGTKLRTGDLSPEILTDYFLKTLRADAEDYSDKFIKGIIPTPDGTRRLQNLRPTERNQFTIMGDGSVRDRIAHATRKKTYDHNFTQNQSCTYLGSDALTPPFGFDKCRLSKLYGILTHRQDLKINRLLLNDGGTIGRPFDKSSEDEAKQYSSYLRNQSGYSLFSSEELQQFTEENSKIRKQTTNTNEVLARLRFNPFRVMICVCADNLEARLLANDFAEEILEAYTDYAKKTGLHLNPKFKIRVVFYVQKSPEMTNKSEHRHRIYLQSRSMQSKDKKSATKIYNKKSSRAHHIEKNNFEFMLGLEKITETMLTAPISKTDNTPLAIAMMQRGYTRMLLRLVRPSRKLGKQKPQEQSNLCTTVFNVLIANNKSLQDRAIVSKLIVAEAFEIVTAIINATNRKLEAFPADLLSRGNPRHLHYLGLEKALIAAAKNNHWVTVRLCLKEHINIGKKTIDDLFLIACKTSARKPDIVFLLKKGVSPGTIDSVFKKALEKSNDPILELILDHCQENVISSGWITGLHLLKFLKRKNTSASKFILKKGTNASWRQTSGQEYALSSALLYGIQHEFNHLLPGLVVHENSFEDTYSGARYWLAVDLARARKNHAALGILQVENNSPQPIDPSNIKVSICYRIFEALFANQPEVAQFRLLDYHQQNQPSSDEEASPLSVLATFSDVFESALSPFKGLLSRHAEAYSKAFFRALFDLYIDSKDQKNLSIIRPIQKKLRDTLLIDQSKVEEIIIKSSIKKLPLNIIHEEMIQSSQHIQSWMENFNLLIYKTDRIRSNIEEVDYLLEIFKFFKEIDRSFMLDRSSTINLNYIIQRNLGFCIEDQNWGRLQLYLTVVNQIDEHEFWYLISIAAKQGLDLEQEIKIFSGLKNLFSGNLDDFLTRMSLEQAEEKNWNSTRFYLTQIEELDKDWLDKFLSLDLDPTLRDEIITQLQPKAYKKSINHKLGEAVHNTPPLWDTVESYLTSIPNPQAYPNFGLALLIAVRDKKIKLAHKLFDVVKSNKWRKRDTQEEVLLSTLFFVVKYNLQDLLIASYNLEKIAYDDNAKRRLRLAFDLATLSKNKSAIVFLKDKIDPNPLLDPQDPLKSICLLVFDAYYIGERELAEWRLFHYGRQFNIIPGDCVNVADGLIMLLGAYERALPNLPYSWANEPYQCIMNILNFYGNPTLSRIMLDKTYATLKGCSCCIEAMIAHNLFITTPLDQRQTLMEFIRGSDHLDKWLMSLTSEVVLQSRKDNPVDSLIAMLEIAIFILEQINKDKKRFFADKSFANSISETVREITNVYQVTNLDQSSLFGFFGSAKKQKVIRLYNQLEETYELLTQIKPDDTRQIDQAPEPDSDNNGTHLLC